MKVLTVICNLPDEATAQHLAQGLVTSGLAACVNILAPCRSIYRWEGQVRCDEEVPVLIKTTDAVYAALEAKIQALHPYKVPEILALDVEHGLPAYLQWVKDEVKLPFESDK